MAYLLALQGILSGWAQGLMAASTAELPVIICSASDPGAVDPARDWPSSGKAAHDCCGTLCRLAGSRARKMSF
ncbi:hypothetical protein KXS07_01925 [Inquilinus limosus]|uniref:hypothetical protein n=1 Tax=Inquilinus limosus TaxID=171674 RepID=UPI003F188765